MTGHCFENEKSEIAKLRKSITMEAAEPTLMRETVFCGEGVYHFIPSLNNTGDPGSKVLTVRRLAASAEVDKRSRH